MGGRKGDWLVRGSATSAARRKVETLAGGRRGAQVRIGRIASAGCCGRQILVQAGRPVKQRQLQHGEHDLTKFFSYDTVLFQTKHSISIHRQTIEDKKFPCKRPTRTTDMNSCSEKRILKKAGCVRRK
jgi:hypothetical protein